MLRLFRRHETDEEIDKRLLKLCKEGEFPPEMEAEVAFHELVEFFLGKGWYVTMPMGHEQFIAECVYQIETKSTMRLFCKHETDEEIRERLLKLCKEEDFGICPPPMDVNVAINELAEFFLGKVWYITDKPMDELFIAECIYQIEIKYKKLKAD